MNPIEMKCDVCGTDKEIAGVAASRAGPASFCFCKNCLIENAEPEFTFEYFYTEVGYEGEFLADWVQSLQTFKDGKYWTWDEWKVWRKNNPPKEKSG